MFSPELLDHFENPRNAGEVAEANATAEVANPVCGDVLRLTLKVSQGMILEARFKAKGCVPLMACGSALTELVKGKTVKQALGLKGDDVIAALRGIPQGSIHAAQMAIETLATSLQQLGSRGDDPLK
jgi:nitrogen fixation NifU-like protein